MNQVLVRPLQASDAEAVAHLFRAHIEHWSGVPATWVSPQHVLVVMEMPGLDPDKDLACLEIDDTLVGYGGLMAQAPYSELTAVRAVALDLTAAHLDAVNRAWLDWAIGAARPYAARAQDPVRSRLAVLAYDGDPFLSFLRESGFEYVRSTYTMKRSLAADEPDVSLPEGVTVRSVVLPDDLPALTEVLAAFADHHGDLVLDRERVEHLMKLPYARPDLSEIASDAAGSCSALVAEANPDAGYVMSLATLRRARNQGIATALLLRSFRNFAAAGCTVVRLDVDADNTTGALALYERAGMTRESEVQFWMRPL